MGRPTPSLLQQLHSVIERTYQMTTGITEVDPFVVGDRGMRRLYAARAIVEQVEAAVSDAKVLVREVAGRLYVSIYYPDALIAALEQRNPLRGLDEQNIDPFAVFVEELDHFLTLADRARRGRGVSLFELELHANVTKYMACRHFLARSRPLGLSANELSWLRWSLFEKYDPPAEPASVRARYRDADRFAGCYTDHLQTLRPRELLAELRTFHSLSGDAAVRRIRALSS